VPEQDNIRTIDTTILRDENGIVFIEFESVLEFIKPFLLNADAVELALRRGVDKGLLEIADRNKNRAQH
jgi:hypothetical protein